MDSYYGVAALCGTILFLIVWCYWYVTKPYAHFPTYWIITNYIKMCMLGKNPGGILSTDVLFQTLIKVSECFRRQGMFLVWIPNPMLLVFSEEKVKACLSAASEDKPEPYKLTHDLFGAEGLGTSKGEIWKRDRKMLNPLFHTHALKDNISTFNECAEALVNELSEIKDKSSVDIQKHLKLCTMNAVLKSILRLNTSAEEKMGPIEIIEDAEKLAEISMHRAVIPWLRPDFIFSKLKSGKEYKKYLDCWNNFTKKVFLDLLESVSKRQEVEAESTDLSLNSKSFAEIVLDDRHTDISFTSRKVQDQVKMFIAAGTSTVASTMMWCLYFLGVHPDIQEKAYNEVASVTDSDLITFEQICKLKYLESVIMEVLRLYPSVPFVAKTLKSDVQFGNYKIPKNTNIAFFIYALHRNAEDFPDPEKFDPDRFLDGSIVKRPFAYMPFSAGNRNCIVIFQAFVDVSERFRREGMFLIWIPYPTLFVFSEEKMKACLSAASDDKPQLYNMTHDLFGAEGLGTSKREIWKRDRKMLNPLFHTHALKDNISTFNEFGKDLVKGLSEIKNKSSVDIQKHLKLCSVNAVLKCILRLNAYTEEKMGPIDIIEDLEKLAEISTHRLVIPWLRPDFIFSKLKSGKEYKKYLDYWNNFTKKALLDLSESVSKRQEVEAESADLTLSSKSFAEILLGDRQRDGSSTSRKVQDQIKTFLTTGTSTVASTMMWCLYLLGLHPDIQEKAYNEVASVTDGDLITFEQLCNLTYLESVIMEVLRLYPSVPIVAKTLKSDVQFGNCKIPKGTDIAFFIYTLHRNAEVFPDPEKFDPDRFLDGSIVKRPFAYMPFSAGNRNCIGKKFAMMQAKVVLAHVIQNFKVTPVTKREDFKLRWLIELQPTKPILIKIAPRNFST